MSRYLYIFNDRVHAKRFLWGLVFLAIFCLLRAAFWQPALADSVLGFGGFSCIGGKANGNLFSADTITTTLATDNGTSAITVTAPPPANNGTFTVPDPTVAGGQCSSTSLGIFGRLLCFFKSTMGQIMSSMYCGFQNALQGPLSAALTLFVVVFGILVTTGMVDLTVRDAMKAMFKIMLVWLFATNADWGIGVGYRFFMLVAEGGSNLVLGAMNSATGQQASLTQPDAVLLSIFNLAASGTGASSGLLASLNLNNYCATMLAPLILFMLFAVPPIAIFLIIMVILYIGLYARAVLGYLTALVLITFLFVLAPLFVSFALFSATKPIFDRWIQYLITYSLQMIIVFAFLAMLEMIPVGTFFVNVVNLLKEYDTTYRIFFIPFPVHTCGICDPGTINAVTANMLTTASASPATPPLACTAVNGGATVKNAPAGEVPDSTGTYYVIPLLSILQHQDFIGFMVAEIIALWLIGYVMEDLLKKAPDIAKEIGALPMALVLGGKSAVGGAQPNYVGLESIEAGFQGFKNQFTKNPFSLNWPRRIIGGIGGGFSGLLYGAAPDSPEARALAAQGEDAQRRVDDMQRNYDDAQQLTLRNKQIFDDLEAQKASQAAIKKAQDNYNLAQGNEAQRKKLLNDARRDKAKIDKSIDKTKLLGLVGPDKGSLIRDFWKTLTPGGDANKKTKEEDPAERSQEPWRNPDVPEN